MTKVVYRKPSKPFNHIMLVVAAPDKADEKIGFILAGERGYVLRDLCKDAGVEKSACHIATVFRKRPLDGKVANNFTTWLAEAMQDVFVPYHGELLRKEHHDDYKKLRDTIHKIRPRVIVVLGEIATWAVAMQSRDNYEDIFNAGPIKFGTTIPKKPFFYVVLPTHAIKTKLDVAKRKHILATLKRAKKLADKKIGP